VRIFIAGATGILGRRVVPLLLQAGHRVIGLSRSAQNRAQLEAQGAASRDADLFDQSSLVEATRDCDAVLHLATAIPTTARPSPSDWQLNDRIRRDGTRHLIEAALHNRCRLYLQQSVVFVYGDQGGAWVDETSPPATRLPSMLASAVEMERLAAEALQRRQLPGQAKAGAVAGFVGTLLIPVALGVAFLGAAATGR
jgi:nucleoside-diphosphate-sugar epimerase